MTDKQFFILNDKGRPNAVKAAQTLPEGWSATYAPPTRSLQANARMWAMLTEVSEQVEWYGKKLTPEDWKAIFSSALKKLDVVPNLDGSGFVALGQSTSKMSVGEMNDLMTLIEAFGAERNVKFSESRETA